MRTAKVFQAYQQAPWRVQLQHVGLFLLGLVCVALVAGVYLYISGITAQTGVEIQVLDQKQSSARREIANLESQLAFLTSSTEMERRAAELGFQPVSHENITYVVVPSYPGRDAATMAPPPNTLEQPRPVIKAEYTKSLWEWVMDDVMEMGVELPEVVR